MFERYAEYGRMYRHKKTTQTFHMRRARMWIECMNVMCERKKCMQCGASMPREKKTITRKHLDDEKYKGFGNVLHGSIFT